MRRETGEDSKEEEGGRERGKYLAHVPRHPNGRGRGDQSTRRRKDGRYYCIPFTRRTDGRGVVVVCIKRKAGEARKGGEVRGKRDSMK